jgi:hypothetical protein
MRSMAQVGFTHDLHEELHLRYREFFESRLAVFLLGKTELFSAVRKISGAILNFINGNKQKILKQLFVDSKIRQELYGENYFGHLVHDVNAVPLPDKILADMQTTLQDENASLSQVMQIHSIFVYRLYDHVQEKNQRLAVMQKYFMDDADVGHVDRVESEEKVSLTTQFGISRHPVFKKLIGQDTTSHLRAVDRFLPNVESPHHRERVDHGLPFVAGRSGHTRTLLVGALLYGDFDSDEFKEYVLSIFVFLAAGGNHSFHEVMDVAHQVGVPCDKKSYSVSLPDSFKNSENYKVLSRIFPEYLEEPVLRERLVQAPVM